MAITLQDPTRQRDPSSRHAFPDIVGEPTLRAPRTLAEELLAVSRAETNEHEPELAERQAALCELEAALSDPPIVRGRLPVLG